MKNEDEIVNIINTGVKGNIKFVNCQNYIPITRVLIDGIDNEGYLYNRIVQLESNSFEIELPKGTATLSFQFTSFQNGTPPDAWNWGFKNTHSEFSAGKNTFKLESLVINDQVIDIGDIEVYASSVFILPMSAGGLTQGKGIIISQLNCTITTNQAEADFFVVQHYYTSPNNDHEVSSKNGIIDVTQAGINVDGVSGDNLFCTDVPSSGYNNSLIYQNLDNIIHGRDWIVKVGESEYAKVCMSGYAYMAEAFGYVVHYIWGINEFLFQEEGL
ncbi:MAG: hypothetical protein J7L46_03315 [Bacteroidales bacterium]|nr:hypothetical protein [Bacteroidales bacterium]